MHIDINQKQISIGDKYQIYIDSIQTHRAAARFLRLLAEINLYELDPEKFVMKINRRFSFFTAKYDITSADGTVYQFRTVSYWRAQYICQYGFDQYEVYRHRGRKCSVYKNGNQVAWWGKKAVTWFNGDNYSIEADNDCDKNLIITLCLIVDNYASNDRKKSTLNINIGRIGFQAKEFNPNWAPKS